MDFIIRDKETGTFIDEFETSFDAYEALKAYEAEDRQEGTYTPGFYEVVPKYLYQVVDTAGDEHEFLCTDSAEEAKAAARELWYHLTAKEKISHIIEVRMNIEEDEFGLLSYDTIEWK